MGPRAEDVAWIEGDITTVALPFHAYDLWHDRAVFHFLTTAQQRQAYVQAVLHAVKPGGHVIVATFAEDGPTHCSGLPVVRYSPDGLHAEFGAPFTLLRHEEEVHRTPRGGLPEVHLLRLPQGFTVTALPRPAKTTAPRRHRHRQWAWAVAALLLQLPATGMAAPDLARGEEIVQGKCFICHGAAGESSSPVFPRLAGQNAGYVARQLSDYRTGKRKSTTMQPMVEDLTPDDFQALG